MNFTRDADINGTSLKGHLRARYSHVVAAFGEPIAEADGYKVSTEWDICFEDGTVATIYDWKSTNLYNQNLPSPEALRLDADSVVGYEWHIGGSDQRAVALVRQVLDSTPVPARAKTQDEQLRDVGIAHAKSIIEMVAQLEFDTSDYPKREEAEERIREDALSVQVRCTEWYSYGATPPAANEFEILIATGGPAARLIGELDDGTPITAKLQTQDWGTPWTDYDSTREEYAAFLAYASVFYFGES